MDDVEDLLPTVAEPAEMTFACEGKRGDVVRIKQASTWWLFRGVELVAADSAGGRGSQIVHFLIGSQHQLTSKMPTLMLAPGVLAGKIACTTAAHGHVVEFEVEFLEDCVWSATLCGKAVK